MLSIHHLYMFIPNALFQQIDKRHPFLREENEKKKEHINNGKTIRVGV